jgi:hypothetical protein
VLVSDVLVIATVTPTQTEVVATLKAAEGEAVTQTCLVAVDPPQGLEVVNVTVYVPGVEKMWQGLAKLDVLFPPLPTSPKFQPYAVVFEQVGP